MGAQVLRPGEGLARSQSIDGEADCALLIVMPLDFGDSCGFWFLYDRQEAIFFSGLLWERGHMHTCCAGPVAFAFLGSFRCNECSMDMPISCTSSSKSRIVFFVAH